MNAWEYEQLAPGLALAVSGEHRFGTDAFLLADFAEPRGIDRCCDLCAGCGIVGALWFRRAERAPQAVWAVEWQAQAVEQMRASIANGGLPAERFFPVQADLREIQSLPMPGELDLVACNPPYKGGGHGILSERESDRIARHETMCTLDEVCAAAARMLKYHGRFCLCQRPERLADVIVAMRTAGLEPKRLRFVQQREQRAPWLFLIEGKRGAKPFMQTLPPLIIEGEGGFSQEVLRIYGKEKNR